MTFLFSVPWILVAPFLIYKEIQTLDLSKTWKLNEKDRKIHFLMKAMPGLERDYFELLDRALPHLEKHPQTVKFIIGQDAPEGSNTWMDTFSSYWLCPYRLREGKGGGLHLYIRKNPDPDDGFILEKVGSVTPSFVVQFQSGKQAQ